MSDQPLFFSMRFQGTGGFDAMVADLTSNVLTHFRFAPAAVEEVSGELKTALTAGLASGAEMRVQFQVREGELEILVSQRERGICRVARRLP